MRPSRSIHLRRPHALRSAVLVGTLLVLQTPGGLARGESDHAHPHHAVPQSALGRSTGVYPIPDVALIDQNAERVELKTLLDSDKPVMLNFIFASCTTVCPVLSAGFAAFQKQLGPDASEIQLVSVTIDPEHDTAEVLKSYSERFRAGQGWVFLTGRRDEVDRVAKAFGAYVSNKMDHRPATYLRAPGSEAWLKIDGFMGASDYATEYAQLIGE